MTLPSAHEYHLTGCLSALLVMVLLFGAAAGALGWLMTREQHFVAPVGYTGDPERGRLLVARYGCGSCHVIPGVEPRGVVGPPLARIGSRSYIAGHYPNIQIHMSEWLRHPQSLKPGTAMPDLGVSERDARDMSAYLGTLR